MSVITVTHKKFLAGLKYKKRKEGKMGKLKGINELVEKYNKLRGREKEAVRESMEELKDYVYEHDQLNEINNLNDIIKATPEYKLGKSIIEDAKNKGEA